MESNIQKKTTTNICKRCGRENCDIVPEGYFERLLEESKTWEKITEDIGDEDEPEPIF